MQTTLQDRKTLTPGEVRTLSAARREALVIHATTPAVKVRMTRHYEGPNQDLYAAATAEARTIAGLTPSARLLPRTGTSPGPSEPPDYGRHDAVLHHQRWPYLMTAESPSGETTSRRRSRCPCGWAPGHAATGHHARPRPPRRHAGWRSGTR